jgi:hypothetical protein
MLLESPRCFAPVRESALFVRDEMSCLVVDGVLFLALDTGSSRCASSGEMTMHACAPGEEVFGAGFSGEYAGFGECGEVIG